MDNQLRAKTDLNTAEIDDKTHGYRDAMATRLRAYRERMRLSQSELAKASGTSVRMIQHYEQRRKDINRAQGRTLHSLAIALHCTMEDLLEPECGEGEGE